MVYGMRNSPNRQIREAGKKRSIFDKVAEIKQRIKADLPELDGSGLITMMCHCRMYYEGRLHYGRRGKPENVLKKRNLTEAEKIVYDILLQMKLNPSTCYRWFLATRLPSDVKEKLEKGQIGQKQAIIISNNRRRVKQSNIGLLMMEEIRIIVGGL